MVSRLIMVSRCSHLLQGHNKLRNQVYSTPKFVIVNWRNTSQGPPSVVPKEGTLTHKYETFISRWPTFYRIHRMVVDGSCWCFSDMKTYFRIRRELSSGKKTIQQLTVPELEVLVQVPHELPRLLLVITLLPLPLTVYVIGFAVIFFPRLILTRHFWSDTQRKEFFLSDVLKSNNYSEQVKQSMGETTPFSLNLGSIKELPTGKLNSICSLHNMYPLPGVINRLQTTSTALQQLDRLIDVDNLSQRQLIFHFYIRRLDFSGLDEDGMRNRLKEWMEYSRPLSSSAYLCAPAYFNNKQ